MAKKITPRADDVVRSMYAPLDARLLEARTVALVLSVTHLALVIKYGTSCSKDTQEWIDKALFDMDKHLEVNSFDVSKCNWSFCLLHIAFSIRKFRSPELAISAWLLFLFNYIITIIFILCLFLIGIWGYATDTGQQRVRKCNASDRE